VVNRSEVRTSTPAATAPEAQASVRSLREATVYAATATIAVYGVFPSVTTIATAVPAVVNASTESGQRRRPTSARQISAPTTTLGTVTTKPGPRSDCEAPIEAVNRKTASNASRT
jgi:hypothetical protein